MEFRLCVGGDITMLSLTLLGRGPQMRKFELLAFSLLTFSTVVVTAIAIDPKGFSLQAWQPLMAAIIALGGGALAFRGAMAKVELDRVVHDAQQLQRQKNLHTRSFFILRLFLTLKCARPPPNSPRDPWDMLPFNGRQRIL
jgi:hypothetical protein